MCDKSASRAISQPHVRFELRRKKDQDQTLIILFGQIVTLAATDPAKKSAVNRLRQQQQTHTQLDATSRTTDTEF